MKMLRFAFACALGLAVAQPALLVAQDAPTRTEQVRFDAGTNGTSLSGRISGREFVTYTLGAEAGQRMSISLSSDNTATYFNLYEPGRGPGDEALAIGEMLPETNRFDGVLPASGVYTLSVFLYRNAARDGQTSNYALDIAITGDTGAVVEGDFADGLAGGPDYWQVKTAGGVLNLRSGATAAANVVGRLANGTPLRNLGCRMAEAARWCRVATLSDPGIEGWAAGDFLIEGSGEGAVTQLPDMIPVPEAETDVLVPGTAYSATGVIECVRNADAAVQTCAFGVVRQGNGSGAVTVDWPEGGSRTIYFEGGTAMSYDTPPSDQAGAMTVTRSGDTSIIMIGEERFVIPDAVIQGG